MKSLQHPLLVFLAAAIATAIALAAPVVPQDALRPRHETRILPGQQNITAPVSFQTVETVQTRVGTITQTCNVTLTPVTGPDGAPAVRREKECTFVVLPLAPARTRIGHSSAQCQPHRKLRASDIHYICDYICDHICRCGHHNHVRRRLDLVQCIRYGHSLCIPTTSIGH